MDDSKFYLSPSFVLLDSLEQGYLTEDSTSDKLYLVSNSKELTPLATLTITIKSRYFNGNFPTEAGIIKRYIESTIGGQLGFSPNKDVTIDYVGVNNNDFYFHKLLNPYFI